MRFLVVFAFLVWNVFLIFFGSPSTDHPNYASWWLRGFDRFSLVEPAFSIAGILFSSIVEDYRLFFVLVNLFLFSVIVMRLWGLAVGLLVLLHPFTVFGLGNTVLGFSAGLFYLAFTGRPLRFISLFVHKGSVFFILSEHRWFMIFFGLLLVLTPVGFIPNILSGFEVTFLNFFLSFLYAVLPLFASSVVLRGRFSRDLSFILAVFVLLAAVWFVIPKAADRSVSLLYLVFLHKTAERFVVLGVTNRVVFMFFYVLYAAVGFMHPSVRANMFS